MIGIDTNVLVRYLAQDDAKQSPLASELFENKLSEEDPGFVSIVTMVETVWVLERAYRLKAGELVAAIKSILQAEVLVVEAAQEVYIAMIAVKQGTGTFSDTIIATLGIKAGCSYTLTFDREASRQQGFRLLQ